MLTDEQFSAALATMMATGNSVDRIAACNAIQADRRELQEQLGNAQIDRVLYKYSENDMNTVRALLKGSRDANTVLRAQRDEAQAGEARLRAVLEGIDWRNVEYWCPWCNQYICEEDGSYSHAKGCPYVAALAADAGKEVLL